MTLDEVKAVLAGASHRINKEERLSNNTGIQLRLDSGAIVNVFNNGTVNCQGRNRKEVEILLKSGTGIANPSAVTSATKAKIFVVYGQDTVARDQLEVLLRRWRLEPLILDQLPSEGQTIIEKLESYTDQVGFAVVLATPDDEGHRTGHPAEQSYRARQNVVLELGMLLSKLGRKKVAILLKQQEGMERPSDIQGLIYIPFREDVKDASGLLAKEMAAQGYQIDSQGL